MTQYSSRTPYFLDGDPVIANYEIIREVWFDGAPIKNVCQRHDLSRSQYYEKENRFIKHGVLGLFPKLKALHYSPVLERLIVMVCKARPSLSQQAMLMLRIAQALVLTRDEADMEGVSQILASYGRSISDRPEDSKFWFRIQRTLNQLSQLNKRTIKGRTQKQRRKTFFHDNDIYHKRLELLRELFFNRSAAIKQICLQYGISATSYYRLVDEYRLYGPWAIIPANLPGKEAMSSATELSIILEKLRYPGCSAQQIVKTLKLRCSKYAVYRVFSRWELTDKNRAPIALDRYCAIETSKEDKVFKGIASAYHLYTEQFLLESRRINRHFELICKKMQTHAYHLCDPGPLILAPLVNDLGIVQAMESYGPARLRGKDLSNLALLNVFRILAGYRRINHLSNNRDRCVALASGLGMFGSRSRYYEDSLEFTFEQIHSLRCDLKSRAKQLGIIEGKKIAFDFHFKQFYGKHSKEKGIGKGPSKSGDMVAGFRPHVAWDLAANTILSMSYYHGGVRAPGILEQYCEQHIFPLFDPVAIKEIYIWIRNTPRRAVYNISSRFVVPTVMFICV